MPPLSKAEMLELQPDASDPNGMFTKCAIYLSFYIYACLSICYIYLYIYIYVYIYIYIYNLN